MGNILMNSPVKLFVAHLNSLEEKNMRIYFGEALTIITVFYFIAVILI